MCGIAGLACRDGSRVPELPVLRRMADAMRHRGPDGEGYHRGPGIGLAVRRLAIVAPEAGAQPIASEDGSVVLVCNGEIYNAVRLRRELEGRGHRFRTASDVEVVVHLYEERGVECLEALRGMFALGLWDASARRLLLARDRLGIKPLAWAETGAGLAFASESKALFAAGLVEPSIDPGAIDALFRFGYVVSPRTAFLGVRHLLPAHRLVRDPDGVRVERWWDGPFDGGAEDRSTRAWVDGLRERLEDAVRVHLRADEPVAAWLSGGLDSSVTTALAAAEVDPPLHVYTLGFADPVYDETAGGTLADHAGAELEVHRTVLDDGALEAYPRVLWHYESPTTTMVEVPRWILAKATAARHRVVLTGEGSDEIFGGYWWYRLHRWTRPLARLPRALRRALLVGPLSPRRRPWGAGAVLAPASPPLERFVALTGPRERETRDRLFAPDFRTAVERALEDGPQAEDALTGPVPSGSFERLQHVDLATRLPDYIELKLDRTSMAHGVEARVPFLDTEVVEYVAGMPTRLKLRGRTEKWALRKAAAGRIPEEIRRRRKRGLAAPFRRWLSGPLPPFAEELLSRPAIEAKGYFDAREVADRLAGHRAGEADFGESLIGVLAVQTLDELFVRGRGP